MSYNKHTVHLLPTIIGKKNIVYSISLTELFVIN